MERDNINRTKYEYQYLLFYRRLTAGRIEKLRGYYCPICDNFVCVHVAFDSVFACVYF
jgi:hypothetical protein